MGGANRAEDRIQYDVAIVGSPVFRLFELTCRFVAPVRRLADEVPRIPSVPIGGVLFRRCGTVSTWTIQERRKPALWQSFDGNIAAMVQAQDASSQIYTSIVRERVSARLSLARCAELRSGDAANRRRCRTSIPEWRFT